MPTADVSVEINYILYINVVTVHEVHEKYASLKRKVLQYHVMAVSAVCLRASLQHRCIYKPIDEKNIQLLRGFWVGIFRKSAGFSTWLLSEGFAQSSSTGTPIALCFTSKVRCKSLRACKIYTI